MPSAEILSHRQQLEDYPVHHLHLEKTVLSVNLYVFSALSTCCISCQFLVLQIQTLTTTSAVCLRLLFPTQTQNPAAFSQGVTTARSPQSTLLKNSVIPLTAKIGTSLTLLPIPLLETLL
jgi:hypothetical protein